ncbi:MAG: alpha/beta fold hydrolase [Thermomicrobiales bacterium]
MDPESIDCRNSRASGTPVIPRATPITWRLAASVDERRIDAYLRLFGAGSLPIGAARGRLAAMGLPHDVVRQTLRRVRRLRDWDVAWTWAAQRYLGEARTLTRTGRDDAAALAQRHAALAYHLAGLFVFDDTRKMRTLRAAASSLFTQALPLVYPNVHRVDLPWRTSTLPAFFVAPELGRAPAPLVVLLNGASTSKEELLLWSGGFLAEGLAVLALDWPGSGESMLTLPPTADCDDLLEAVVPFAMSQRAIDADRIGLVGLSLGAAVATRVAAADRRIGAVVAVTPPYDPRVWLSHAQPLLQRHLIAQAGGVERARRLAAEFALPGVVSRVRCPLLVIGAGRDLIVPPEEALRYCAEAGINGTLVWYPDGHHAVYEELPDWTRLSARWLVAAMSGTTSSTWVDHIERESSVSALT